MADSEDKNLFYTRAAFTEKKFQPYAIAIGRVAMSWNALMETMGALFWMLMSGPKEDLDASMAVWQAVKMDRSKRDMLKAAIEHIPPKFRETFPSCRDEILWLIGEANNLEDARNNVVHAPLTLVTTLKSFSVHAKNRNKKGRKKRIPADAKVVAQDFFLNERAKRFSGKLYLVESRLCYEKGVVLRNYAQTLFEALKNPDATWPKRPKLPVRRMPKSIPPNLQGSG